MAKLFAGVTATTGGACVVVLRLDGDTYEVVSAMEINLQTGDRAQALHRFRGEVEDVLKNAGVERVFLKATEAGSRISKGHLDSAETRGAAIVACAAAAEVTLVKKAVVSRTFGTRKADEYVADDSFWADKGLGNLKKGLREAAFVVVASN